MRCTRSTAPVAAAACDLLTCISCITLRPSTLALSPHSLFQLQSSLAHSETTRCTFDQGRRGIQKSGTPIHGLILHRCPERLQDSACQKPKDTMVKSKRCVPWGLHPILRCPIDNHFPLLDAYQVATGTWKHLIMAAIPRLCLNCMLGVTSPEPPLDCSQTELLPQSTPSSPDLHCCSGIAHASGTLLNSIWLVEDPGSYRRQVRTKSQ